MQKRMLMLLVALAILLFSLFAGNGKVNGPSLRWEELSGAEQEALDLALEDPYAQWYRYDTQEYFQGMALAVYQLNLETGKWKRLRGGEIRFDQSKGLAGFGFDGSSKLWVALYNQGFSKLAMMNPDEVASEYTISSVWWKKGAMAMQADTEIPLGVQSILLTEDARPVSPEEMGEPEKLKNREGIRAAYALTVTFLPEAREQFKSWVEE